MAQTELASELARMQVELEKAEEPFEIIRKHWGRILWPLVGIGFLAVVTIAAFLFIALLNTAASGIFIMILATLYLALAIYGLSEWYSYKQSALVISNQRVIDIQQNNFFSRRVQTIDLHEIQSCTGELSSGWGTVFGYGNLGIHTVGDKPMHVNYIPIPETVCNQVMHYHNLVAHGGVESAHNPKAVHTGEDKTPALETLHEVAEATAAPPPKPGDKPETAKLKENPLIKQDPQLPQKEEQLGQDAAATAQPALTSLTPALSSQPTQTLLMFHVPSEKLDTALTGLPAQKEPTKRYLPKTDYFEIEVIVPTDQVPKLVENLKTEGAEDIVGEQLDLVG